MTAANVAKRRSTLLLMRLDILAKADKGTLTWETLPGGKIRITSNSLPSGDATLMPGSSWPCGSAIPVRSTRATSRTWSDRSFLEGSGHLMQQRVAGEDDIDDPDSCNATIAKVTTSPHGDNATKAEAAGG